jgi:hypothetical protein
VQWAVLPGPGNNLRSISPTKFTSRVKIFLHILTLFNFRLAIHVRNQFMSSANLIYLVSLAIFTFFHSLQLTLRFSGVISPEVLPFFNHKLRYSAEISAFCLGD